MIRKYLAHAALASALAIGGVTFSAATSHADTSQATDACLDGHNTTVITGMQCAPGTPTASQVCRTGQAHMTNGEDYCPPPKFVVVGEYQLGTVWMPKISVPTRLDVGMAPKGSTAAKRKRCANMGGSNMTWSPKGRVWICHNADY